MTILLDFLSRELLFLAILAALGAWPATFLSSRFSPLARTAMAPALGMCLGTVVFTSTLWFLPARSTSWLVLLLIAVSTGAAIYRIRPHIVALRDSLAPQQVFFGVVSLLMIVIAVSAPTVYTFLQNNSVGPVTYLAPDAGAYTLTIDAMIHESLQTAEANSHGPAHDLAEAYLGHYVAGVQQMDIDPFEANVDALIGFGGTDTQSPFMLAALVTGALGAFASMLYFLRGRTWVAAFAAVLYGGPLFLQLFFDGSEGALCGLSVLVPIAVVSVDAIVQASPANALLLALLGAGLLALYPLFAVPVAIVGLGALLVLMLRRHSRSGLDIGWLKQGVQFCVFTVFVLLIIDPVVSLRDIRYWHSANAIAATSLPRYDLAAQFLPGWLLQSRGLYSLSFASSSTFSDILLGGLIPLLGVAVIFIGIRRHRVAWMPLFLVCVSGALAIYEYGHTSASGYTCSYCEDRSLLPVTVALILLLSLGIGALAVSPSVLKRAAGVCAAAAFLVGSGVTLERERVLFSEGSQFLPSAVGTVLKKLPQGAIVELEGFDEAQPNPVASFMFAYARADESAWGRVSVPADYDENTSLMYFGGLDGLGAGLPSSAFRPHYEYVLTRLAAVETGRRVLSRDGAVALEARSQSVDLLIDYGFTVAPLNSESSGFPYQDVWSNEPIQVIVTGAASQHTYVRLWFDLPVSEQAIHISARHIVSERLAERKLAVCLETTGSTESRIADLVIPPGTGERLVAAVASTRECPPLGNALRS